MAPINKTAGKYAACRENVEAKLAAGGAPSKYADALDKCETKFSARSWRTRPWRRARCVRAFPFMAQTASTCRSIGRAAYGFCIWCEQVVAKFARTHVGGDLRYPSAAGRTQALGHLRFFYVHGKCVKSGDRET